MTYFLTYGLTAAVMSATWVWRVPWVLSIPICAAVRVLGMLGYLVISSWTLRENMFALLMANVFSLLVSATDMPLIHAACVDCKTKCQEQQFSAVQHKAALANLRLCQNSDGTC